MEAMGVSTTVAHHEPSSTTSQMVPVSESSIKMISPPAVSLRPPAALISCLEWIDSCVSKIEACFKDMNPAGLDEDQALKADLKVFYTEQLVSRFHLLSQSTFNTSKEFTSPLLQHYIHDHYTYGLPRATLTLGKHDKQGLFYIQLQYEDMPVSFSGCERTPIQPLADFPDHQ